MDIDTIELKVLNYNISTLIIDFHNLSRYDLKFKQSNASILDDDLAKYLEQSFTYIALSIIIFLLTTLIILITCCCSCVYNSSRKKKHSSSSSSLSMIKILSSIIIILITILTMVTYYFGYLGQENFIDFSSKTCEQFDLFINKIKFIGNNTKLIINSSNNTFFEIDERFMEIETTIENYENELLKQQFDHIKNEYNENINETIKLALKNVDNQLDENGNLNKISNELHENIDKCYDLNKDIKTIFLKLLIILALLTTIFIFAIFHPCIRICSCTFGYLFMIILMIIALSSFIVLLIGSDFCLESKYLLKHIYKTKIDSSLNKSINYYLFCNDINTNNNDLIVKNNSIDSIDIENLIITIEKKLNDAIKQLNKINNEISEICSLPEFYPNSEDIKIICDDIKTFWDDTDKKLKIIINDIRDDIINEIKCKNITPIVNDFLTNICTNLYNSFFLIFINGLTAFFGYFMLIMIVITTF